MKQRISVTVSFKTEYEGREVTVMYSMTFDHKVKKKKRSDW